VPQMMNAGSVVDRILDRMRVTAVIPDSLAGEVHRLAGRRNLSESIVHALWEWVDEQRLRRLNELVRQRPPRFAEHFSVEAAGAPSSPRAR